MTAPLVTRSQSDSDQIDYTPGSAKSPGDVVVSGDLIGIVPSGRAGAGIEANELGALQVDEGPWVFPKATSGGSAFTFGQPAFWNAGASQASNDGTTGRRLGIASKAAADGDATVEIHLDESSHPQAAVVAAVATANATDLATSEALANQLKTTLNAILTSLKAAGLMASS